MGVVTEVNSLEDMCAMMCDNVLPTSEGEWWYFTFGYGQRHEGHYVKINGTYEEARNKMFEMFGKDWAFQYSEEQWNDWLERRPPWVPLETELEVIE